MRRECAACRKEFDARRSTAKFCSDACRVRANRAGVSGQTPPPSLPVNSSAGASTGAARKWLAVRKLDAESSPTAADLLVVAESIDTAVRTGQVQYVAALARQAAALRAEIDQREAERQREAEEALNDDDADGGPEAWDAEAI